VLQLEVEIGRSAPAVSGGGRAEQKREAAWSEEDEAGWSQKG
jgi:hypothetical protein